MLVESRYNPPSRLHPARELTYVTNIVVISGGMKPKSDVKYQDLISTKELYNC